MCSSAFRSKEDALFIEEYRRAGLRWVEYACVATALLLLLFIAFPSLSRQYALAAVGIRAAMMAVLIAVILMLRWRPALVVVHYTAIVGGACALVLLGLAALMAAPGFDSVSIDFSPTPAMLFGLFLSYAFLRLPLLVVSAVGWTFSISVVLSVPHGFAGAGQVRIMLYLGAINMLGMLLSRSIETRERELFYQRRRAEAALKLSDERAVAAEEAHAEKSRLLGAVSHDLRQPIMAASTYLSVLRSGLDRGDFGKVRRQAGYLADSVGMLGATLDHLLLAARYDSRNEPIRIEAVELGPLLEQLRQTFEAEALGKGIELRFRMPAQRLVVTSDATALWRILMNLVSNAIKFTSSDGRTGRGVVVRASLARGVCRIDVADTGEGIDESQIRAIWQAYFQVHNSERNRARGLGLGLFLVRRVLDQLENHVLTLRSRPGRGTRFTLTLPGASLGAPREVHSQPRKLEAKALQLLAGAYVMVLEDDSDARRAILELLDDWGVVHASGSTFEELLADAQTAARPPDALITDFRLPGQLTGAGCIQELRRLLDLDFPAVIVTGESDLISVREVMPADVVLLPKPFEPMSLAAALVSAVERARRAESL